MIIFRSVTWCWRDLDVTYNVNLPSENAHATPATSITALSSFQISHIRPSCVSLPSVKHFPVSDKTSSVTILWNGYIFSSWTYIYFKNILSNKSCGKARREFRRRFPGRSVPRRKTILILLKGFNENICNIIIINSVSTEEIVHVNDVS